MGPGSYNDLNNLVEQLEGNRKLVGPTVVINESKAVHSVAPHTDNLIVYRVKDAGRNEPSPQNFEGHSWTPNEWVNRWLPSLGAGIRQDGKPYALSFLNEVWRGEDAAYWRDFYIQLMIECWGRSIFCTCLNTSVGIFNQSHYLYLRPVIEKAQQLGMYPAFNTYYKSDNPGLWEYMLPLMNEYQNAKWYVNELGFFENDATYAGREALKQLLARHAALWTHPSYLGAALWAIAPNSDWRHSNIPTSDFDVIVTAAGSV